jgi:hypothetical protein
MKLIFEAIKALFRKVEANAIALSKRVTKAQNTANNAQNTANTANRKASVAQNTANNAQNTANDAQNTATDAKELADSVRLMVQNLDSNKATLQNFTCPLSINDAFGHEVGKTFRATQDGQMFGGQLFFKGATVLMKFNTRIGTITAALTATGHYDALGLINWNDPETSSTGNESYLVRVGNKSTTSYVELVRIA